MGTWVLFGGGGGGKVTRA